VPTNPSSNSSGSNTYRNGQTAQPGGTKAPVSLKSNKAQQPNKPVVVQ